MFLLFATCALFSAAGLVHGAGIKDLLIPTVPFAASCFSLLNNVTRTVDESACTAVQANYTNRFLRVAEPGAYMTTQWETCQTSGAKCLLDDVNPSDPLAFTSGLQCSQGSVPRFSIAVQTPEDVREAIDYAVCEGLPLVIKNTGHDYKGRSSAPNALSLWTHNLTNLSYNPSFVPDGCTKPYSGITSGAGVIFRDFYNFAGANNLTVVGAGSDPTVGAVGGWLQGGGHGMISNTYGLGADRVLQFRVVTANGKYLTANECQNQDLFWALRGGGGGTFGVVMEATVLADPQVPIQVALVAFNPLANNTRAVWDLVLENQLQWTKGGWGGLLNTKQVLYVNPKLNSTAAAESIKALSDFATSLGNQALKVLFTELPYYTSFFNAIIAPNPAPIGQNAALASRLIPVSNLATADSRSRLLDALVYATTNVSDIRIFSTTPYSHPGRSPTATALTGAWRDSVYHVIVNKVWEFNATTADIQGAYTDLTDAVAGLRAITPDASYQNEGDIHEPNHEVAFWGDNYARLLNVKNKYDPEGIFECWQCVGWDPKSERYTCYP
ncbi:FAD-binding domain-containing protein [Amylostereum chailletii]|nr:FAD-binding domain-containing protein [Amylostereum chailletii]